MKRILKWLVGLLIIVALLAAVAVYGAIHYAKSDKFKQDIITRVKQETGRDLSIEGDLNLSFYPWAGVDIKKIRLSNAEGFGDKPFLKAESLALRIKTMPLLKKQYELDTLRLHGAEINLAKNKEGVTNWADLVKSNNSEEVSSNPPELAAVILGGVDIKDGKFRWDDQTTGQKIEVNDLNANTGELSFGEPVKLIASLNAKANQPAINSKINLNGTLEYDLDNERYSIKPLDVKAILKGKNIPSGKTELTFNTNVDIDLDNETATISDLRLNALGTQLTADIQAADVQSSEPSVEGKFVLEGKDIANLFKVLEIEPLASELAKQKNKSFQLNSSLAMDMDEQTFEMPDLSMKLLGSDINASIDATNIKSDAPSAKGKLIAKGTNLPLFLKVFGQFQSGETKTLSTLGNDLSKTKQKSFDVAIEFDSDLDKGVVSVPALSAKLLGATIEGELSAKNITNDKPSMKGHLKAKGPDLPSLLRLVGNLQSSDSSLAEFGNKLSSAKDKNFDIDTVFNVDQASGNIDVSKLDARLLGLLVNGHMQGKNLDSGKGALDGQLSIKSKETKSLLVAFDQQELAEVVKSIDVNAGVKGSMQDLTLSPFNMKAVLSGKNIPNSPVSLNLKADTKANLDKGNVAIHNLSLKGLGLDLKGNINATDVQEALNFSGDISIAPFNVRQFLKQLNQAAPNTADAKVLNKFALSSNLKGSRNAISLTKLDVVLDDSQLKGDVSIAGFEKPVIKFGVGIDSINVDRYLPPETKTKATPETAAASAAQLPIETLRDLNINGDLLIGKLVYSNIKMNDVKLSLKAKDGMLQFSPAEAKLYEGSYAGDIALDATDKIPKLKVDTQFKDILVEPLLSDLTGEATLTGKGNVGMTLTSSGADINTLRNTLSGKGQFALEDGVMKGIDIAKVLKQVEIKIENKDFGSLTKIDKEGETPFDSVTGTLQINSGVVRNEDLALLAPGFVVNGQGMVMNLQDQTWNYDLEIKADETHVSEGEETYNVGGHRIPIHCSGKLADKDCTPDLAKIVGAVATKQINKKLGGFLDKLTGNEEKEAPALKALTGDESSNLSNDVEKPSLTDGLIQLIKPGSSDKPDQQDAAAKEAAAKEAAAKEAAAKEAAAQEAAAKEAAAQDVAAKEAAAQDVAAKEAAAQDVAAKEAAAQEAAAKEAAAKEAAAKEAAAKEAAAKEAAAQEAAAKEAAAQDAAAKEAAAQDAAAKEAAAQEAAAKEATAQEAAAKEAAAQEAAAKEAAAQEAAAKEAAAQEAAAKEAAAQDTAAKEAAAQEAAAKEAAAKETVSPVTKDTPVVETGSEPVVEPVQQEAVDVQAPVEQTKEKAVEEISKDKGK